MADINEEYNRLGRHIEGQFRLIVQIFTVSIVASVALLGYVLKVLSEATDFSGIEPFLALTPLVIVLPCAVLIDYLRREIFKWSMYIKVYLNDGKNWRYESELTRYRQQFPEEESWDAIGITYASILLLCSLLFWWGIDMASMSIYWLLVLLIPAVLFYCWWIRYYGIPKHCSDRYETRWSQIKAINAAPKQSRPTLVSAGVLGIFSFGIFIYLLIRRLTRKQK